MKKILVADDSKIISNIISRAFQNEYEVVVAVNGKEAIDIVKNNVDDSIIGLFLDLNMPEVDGFAVLDYFKENDLFKKIPISIITGADDKISIEKAYKYPIADILLKPFNEKDLKKILEKTINYNI